MNNERGEEMGEKILTVDDLKKMKPGIFSTGTTNDPRLMFGLPVRWVAVRGGIHDFAVYYHNIDMTKEFIRDCGEKVHNMDVVKTLVPCDEEALEMYRY